MLCWDGAWAWGQTGTTVKVYRCPTGTATTCADRLRADFGAIPEVRIAANQRTSELVIRASEATHLEIGRRLAALASTGNPPAPPNSAPASAVAETPAQRTPTQGPSGAGATAARLPVSRSVALRSSTPKQFEAALWAALGQRLSAVEPPGPQARRYRLALPGGASIDLTIPPTGGQVTVEGMPAAVEAAVRLIQILDSPSDNPDRATRLVPVGNAQPATIERAATAINSAPATPLPRVAMEDGQSQGRQPGPAAPSSPMRTPPVAPAPPASGAPGAPQDRVGFVGPVQIEMIGGLDVIALHGNRRDVDRAVEIINQIEQLSAVAVPAIEVCRLRYVDCQTMGVLVRSVYDEIYLARQGGVSITPLVTPNAILVVGRRENVQTVTELVGRLDEPVAPDTQFQVFPLRHAGPTAVQASIQEFFADRGGLGPLVRTTIDIRSNSIFVHASPRDMAEVAEMIRRIDTPTGPAVNEMRVIRLEHSLAADLALIMQSAIGAATSGAGRQGPGMQAPSGNQPLAPMQTPGGAQTPGAMRPDTDQRSIMLRFLTTDAQGRRLVSSGILGDVRITADLRSNALVVSAPAECIELIEALIHQLDRLPSAEAQIKVFSIVNGDATNLAEMLRILFSTQAALVQAMAQTAAGSGENSLVGLRFAVDSRTNSIIASGSMGDLNVVEAILSRLDDGDVRHRQSVVFRLKNSPAQDVAEAINTFLRTERQVQQITPGLTSPFQQLDREVVVVPEPVSNSLILSATPRFFEEMRGLIEQLDARPPMVMIQVLIADVSLGDTNEFGIELGLQDAVLFDRSLLSSAGALVPGYNFNNQPLGNSGSPQAQAGASNVGGQGLSSFSVGRVNGPLGFGGLVLSAASENVSVLLRALSECHRVDVLQRPQVMTLDNQPAFIQVGQRVPQITGTQVNQSGQSNAITLINVGLILAVTPRISPDGLVVMEINAEKSEVGPDAEGIPVAISDGQVIRSPRINTATAQTTVSATSGQTVILGGLISKNATQLHRKVPWLGDVPYLGRLFRFDSVSTSRQELLIIMTPHIVRSEADAEAIKRTEAARMNWCLCDVISMYGDAGLRRRTDEWPDNEVPTVYPDRAPQPPAKPEPVGQSGGAKTIPAPSGTPGDRPTQLPAEPAPVGQPGGPEMIPVPSGTPSDRPTPAQPPARNGAQGWLRRPQSANSEGPSDAPVAYRQTSGYQ